jgi:hypothetical protein
LVKCAKLIIEADWNLQYICSSDDNVAQWSAQNAIPFTQDYAEFKKQIIDCPPDYLFSIVNEVIIDEVCFKCSKTSFPSIITMPCCRITPACTLLSGHFIIKKYNMALPGILCNRR